MREEFLSGNSRDFRQRYRHCYGFFTPENSNKSLLVYLTEIDENHAKFIDIKRTEYMALADKGNFFEFIPIQKKLFIHKDSVVLAQRVPARQWTRGVSNSNTQFLDVTRNNRNMSTGFDLVESAFIKDPPGSSNPNAVLLNDTFAITNNTVYVYNQAIGKYNPDKLEITVSNPMFRQELIDAITDTPLRLV